MGQLHIEAVALVDGECALCNRITKFAVRRDPALRLRFAALQSEEGQRLLELYGLDPDRRDTFLLLTHGCYFTCSTAILELLGMLSGGWKLLRGFKGVPRVIRDALYVLVAVSRHRLNRFYKGPNALGSSCSMADARLLQGRLLTGEQEVERFWQRQQELKRNRIQQERKPLNAKDDGG